MNIRKILTLLLAVNLSAAIVCNWPATNKMLVIANALALLFFIARKAITKEN